ncbi:MAG: hypothetical protein HGN29_12670 [Asgard group archaeon]|nr:hypothetical protein [Asgard group archaeon]
MTDLEFRDVINYQEEGVMVIKDPKLTKMVKDDNYYSVLWALRGGPLTVKEISKKYKQFVILKVEKMGLEGEKREKKIEECCRSEKTIYRYLKDLLEAGLVAKAGQRVILGKTITENLFSRTARIYLVEETKEGWWKSDESRNVLERASRILSLVKHIPPPSLDCLAEIMDELHRANNAVIVKWMDEHYEDVSRIFLEGSFNENDKVLAVLKTISLLLNFDDYAKKAEGCLKIPK